MTVEVVNFDKKDKQNVLEDLASDYWKIYSKFKEKGFSDHQAMTLLIEVVRVNVLDYVE